MTPDRDSFPESGIIRRIPLMPGQSTAREAKEHSGLLPDPSTLESSDQFVIEYFDSGALAFFAEKDILYGIPDSAAHILSSIEKNHALVDLVTLLSDRADISNGASEESIHTSCMNLLRFGIIRMHAESGYCDPSADNAETMARKIPILESRYEIQYSDNDPFLVDTTNGRRYPLNATGAWILDHCTGKNTVMDIIDELQRACPGTSAEQIERDGISFIMEIESIGVVVLQSI